MSNLKRFAQTPPAPEAAAPPPDPSAGMGMPAMDPGMALGMPPGGGLGAPTAGAPGGGPTEATSSSNLKFPLENLGMILKDANIEKVLAETFSSSSNINTNSEEEIANKIWQEYGGDKFGGVYPGRLGERQPKKETDDKEVERTDETKWKRLPSGKSLADLDITLQDMINSVKAISFGISKAKSKEAPAGGGGGGLMANIQHHRRMVRLSESLDKMGFHKLADKIIPFI